VKRLEGGVAELVESGEVADAVFVPYGDVDDELEAGELPSHARGPRWDLSVFGFVGCGGGVRFDLVLSDARLVILRNGLERVVSTGSSEPIGGTRLVRLDERVIILVLRVLIRVIVIVIAHEDGFKLLEGGDDVVASFGTTSDG